MKHPLTTNLYVWYAAALVPVAAALFVFPGAPPVQTLLDLLGVGVLTTLLYRRV